MYYDVVCSIYEERGTCNCGDIRIDSHLICGGFETEDKAMEYIEKNDCSQYDHCCSNGEYPCIEIEVYKEDGSVIRVVIVD